ncbi:MAG: translation initiation factor IF-2 [Bacteroidales bacterium]|nr:translation initiation factor IF-2 [Bacteroidales bacterium]
MSIRLSKVAKDFNVGIQTLVESLQKKGVSIDSNPNTKISDEQYNLLVKEFSKDKNLKIESDRISQERHNKDKNKASLSIEGYESEPAKDSDKTKVAPAQPQEKEEDATQEIKIEIEKEQMPRIKEVGRIDLDALNKKPVSNEKKVKSDDVQKKKPIEKKEPVKTIAETPIAKKQEPEIKVREQKVAEQKETVKAMPQENEDKEVEKMQDKIQEDNSQQKDGEVFRLSKPTLSTSINVIGTIDLNAINQQTRPKKKSKEEKKKERESKDFRKDNQKKPASQGQQHSDDKQNPNRPKLVKAGEGGASNNDQDRKKRSRINKQKVDVSNNQSQNQNQNQQGNKKSHGSNQNNNNQANQDRRKVNLKKPVIKAEVSDEDVQKQIKETLARLTSKGAQKKGSKYRKEKREMAAGRMAAELEAEAAESKLLKLTEFVTANDLANMMDVSVNQVIGTCMSIGIMVSINQRLDAETINIVAEEFGFKTEYVSAEVVEAINVEEDHEDDLVQRPPIVTVMGHVDHGKTSLLDYVRKANVIAGEAGGITQHIGAYNVTLSDGRHVTFLDTPGHEAFTAMRARGAQVTDIAIIIVAADDAVMPQTIEAINHASAANVPIVFAINKVDKPHANPEKIKEELAQMNYLVEDWGGKYQSQEISAKKGQGVNELLEKVLLEAELLDLKANPERRAIGSVIESTLDKGRGYVATVLVSNGTLKMGDIVLAGTHFGRVKAMFNERNQKVDEAGPSVPVQILGFNGAPQAGDQFHVLETEQEAREIATKREQLAREQGLRTQKLLTLDDIGRRIAIGNFQELNVIVKGDVDGSVEALSDSLIKLSTPEIQVNVIHKAVGQISESDVTLAAASNAIIIGFQVRPSLPARRLAERDGVEVRLYSIIYDAIEEVKDAMEGMLAPEIKEEIVAYLEIRETFKITKVGTVAGCIVKEGKIKRSNKIRIIRDGIVIYSGELGSLKRFKDDVKEVTTNFECGLNIDKFNDLKVGDLIEAYEETQVKKTL